MFIRVYVECFISIIIYKIGLKNILKTRGYSIKDTLNLSSKYTIGPPISS